MIESQWTTWWQIDFPCEFDRLTTEKNNKCLIEVLGEEWLSKRIKKKSVKNPLIQRWLNNGAKSFLELNALAEDIKLIRNIPGFETILNDLKVSDYCMATWHIIRTAAMFERAKKGIVTVFHPQTSQSIPDFSILINDKEYAVEGKLLVKSECEKTFSDYSSKLLKRINKKVYLDNQIYPQVLVVLKDFNSLPEIPDVTKSIIDGVKGYNGEAIKGSFEKFNIFIEPSKVTKKEFSTHKLINILCPRSEKENLRASERIKGASGQLKKYLKDMSGIVCIGITQHQDPFCIREALIKRFENHQLRSISEVILIKTGVHFGSPKNSTLDIIGTVRNVNAIKEVPTKGVELKPIGLSDSFIFNKDLISSYRAVEVEGKIVDTNFELQMPDIRYLSSNHLL